MSAYAVTMLIHSYLRWLIVAFALLLIVRTARGWARAADWREPDQRMHNIFIALVNTQFTLGIVLYLFLSPISAAFFANPGRSMKDPVLRFFGMEHALAMFVAVSLVHVGRIRAKKAPTSQLRQRRVCMSTLLVLLLIGLSIPWPFLRYGRPLLRGVSSSTQDANGAHARIAHAAPAHRTAGGAASSGDFSRR